MNKYKIAAELLEERATRTTDETAFTVKVFKNSENEECRIVLYPDTERRGDDSAAFYHMEDVVSVCNALNLRCYASPCIKQTPDGPVATFQVHIF